ncbi:MAG TPA: ABC transporter substrate-binding protein [Acidimicrobiales bacterium]|nr:ABC transporter substrate-binding protein [Acidimicrobiales bacterium]
MKRRRLAVFAVAGAAAAASVGVAAPSMAASSSKAPITIAWMATLSGPYAQPGVNNDIKLATDQINSQGGIDGHKVSFVAYDANLTPQQAVTATQKALGSKPTAFIGYSVDDQIQATAQLLKQSGIPVLAVAQGPAASSNAVHVPNLYTMVPNLVSAIQASSTYAFTKFHPKSVGIFHTDDTASNADAATAQALLKKQGVKDFTVRSASDQATDTTQQALAMKGDQVVFEFGFPLVEANFNTALSQNGIDVPIQGDQTGNFLAAYGLNKPAQLTKYAFTPYCYPPVLPSKQAKAYTAAYAAAYPGQSLQTSVAYVYDAVELLGAAIKADGGNLSSSAINKELGTITYNGACGPYHADANHDLMHQVAMVSYANGINPGELAATFHEGPVPASYFKS